MRYDYEVIARMAADLRTDAEAEQPARQGHRQTGGTERPTGEEGSGDRTGGGACGKRPLSSARNKPRKATSALVWKKRKVDRGPRSKCCAKTWLQVRGDVPATPEEPEEGD